MEYIKPSKDPNSPAYECAEHGAQQEDLKIVRDLRAGTRVLREKGEKYLPVEEAEEERDYKVRLSRAVLYNAYDRAIGAMVGLIFRRSPVLGNDVPEEIRGRAARGDAAALEGIAESIGANGAHWAVVAEEFAEMGVDEGHAFLYVDMPPAPEEGARLDEVGRRRPYWAIYKKDQAVNWRREGRRLTQITFREVTREPDGAFGETEVIRYRVLRPGSWELYREVKGRDQQVQVIPETDADGRPMRGTTPLAEIPIAVASTGRTGALSTRPKLLDVAMINLLHYAESSDYRIYLHICSRPIPWATGYDKEPARFGPYVFFKLKDGGQVQFAETSGAALGAARQDLLDLQDQMSLLSLSMLATKAPTNTATEELLDSVKEESDLMRFARSLQDALELALKWTAQYLAAASQFQIAPAALARVSGGSVTLGCKMEDLVLPPEEMRVYSEMAGRVFSTETIRQIIAKTRREALPEDYTEEAEEARLRAEQAAAGLAAQDLGAAALAAFDREAAQ